MDVGVRRVSAFAVCVSISLYVIISTSTKSVNLNFNDNCRNDNYGVVSGASACYIGNFAGWFSGSLWYACILSQIIKDAMVTRCCGLSIIWAWLNFMASTANAFAVFAWQLPLFTRVMAVYMPVLNGVVLLQLAYFRNISIRPLNHGDVTFTPVHWCICLVIWIGILLTGAGVRSPHVVDVYSWLAIAMWSVEGFFQIFVNFRRGTCDGQSYHALALTLVGKSCDLLTQWLLQMPSRYLLLAYFSSAAGFLNVLQALAMYDFGMVWWKQLARALVGVYVVGTLYGFMTYLLWWAPFQHQDWIRNSKFRWYLIPAPLLVSSIAAVGYARSKTRKEEWLKVVQAPEDSHWDTSDPWGLNDDGKLTSTSGK